VSVLGSIKGVTITPQRPTSDGLGNLTFTGEPGGGPALPPIENAVFMLEPAGGGINRMTATSVYPETGILFVPRGSDLRNGDRVPFGSRNFVVVGEPLWDMNHPMTDEDFGYVEVRIQWGG
jgi:hypothetical protein